jgi:hypothetical protein
MLGMDKEMGANRIHHRCSIQQRMGRNPLKVHDDILDAVSSAIPYFKGNFDLRAYIDWELKVEMEFDEYDLSEEQMISAASNALTRYALNEWKHICRHNKVPQSWIDFKILFRDVYIPAYYADYLIAKLEKLS